VTADHYGRGRGAHVLGVNGLMELVAVVELRNAGFLTQAIRCAIENLRELSEQHRPLAPLTLLVNGTETAWEDATDISGVTISALHRPGQRLMIFPLGERHAELLHQLESDDSSRPDAQPSPPILTEKAAYVA